MKSVLLHINQDPGQAARLAAAMEVVRAHNGQLICLQATPLDAYFFVGDPFGGSYVPSGIFETFRQNEKLEQVRIEDTLKREGIDWQWLHAEGSAAQTIIEHAKFADLVVLSQPEEKETILPRRAPLAADVALPGQSPVLLVPAAGQRFTNSSAAMIAWNGSPEAANAIRQSRSLLRAAPKLHIVSVSEKGEKPSLDDVRNYLARYGVTAESHDWPLDGDTVANALIAAAASLEAKYIVLGAYGHSRLRETFLGGVTQDLITTSPVPLILAH